MIKRLFWAGIGYVAGVLSSVWVQRRVRRAVDQYTPEHVRQQVKVQFREQVTDRTRDLADRARQTVIDLREAAQEGRAAMRESERDLRAEFDDRPHSSYRGGAGSTSPLRSSPPATRPRTT